MEFRSPDVAKALNAEAIEYFTESLSDPAEGKKVVFELISKLGNAVESLPDWHPILTNPENKTIYNVYSLSDLDLYRDRDHTREFVRGFVTCPYSEEAADNLVDKVNSVYGLSAYRISESLYADNAYPVVVEADEVILEADGTIRSRDALRWFIKKLSKETDDAEVAETWWNIRSLIMGQPHGSRSSLVVNSHTASHMKKILKAINDSGVFGPIKESSLEMLSKNKRDKISENLIRAAVDNWDKSSPEFTFEMRDEICKAVINDTWKDGTELSVRVTVGKNELRTQGFYYPKSGRMDYTNPLGKRSVAEKFD